MASVVTAEVPDAQEWVGAELLLGNYNEVSVDAPGIVLQPWEARI